MSEVAVDFGTSNTVLARFNEASGRAETVEIPGISTEMRYRLTEDGEEHRVFVVPSMIHYAEKEILIADQVVSRGLADHPATFRWMKRAIAQGVTAKRKTVDGFKNAAEAGEDFLRQLLFYASDRISLEEDSFTFTAPVEAFETFQDWIWRFCEGASIRRVRLLDEPTSCVFGYHGVARKDERFAVVDFGGGTLDVAVVRIDLGANTERKAIPLGRAGCDLGGMDIDQWMCGDFCARHKLDAAERRDLEPLILRRAEAAKIRLSDPAEETAEVAILNDRGRQARLLRTVYTRSCADCERRKQGKDPCLGCVLMARGFLKQVKETLDRALNNAAHTANLGPSDITKVLVTGGSSMIPAVHRLLEDRFEDRLEYDHPFDAVVRGACRGEVQTTLHHDYAVEAANGQNQYEFVTLFQQGTEYPTAAGAVVRTCNGSYDGQTRIEFKIFELSQMKRRAEDSIVNPDGSLRRDAHVVTDKHYIRLNGVDKDATFIVANPPIRKDRDSKRFLCSFAIDGNRRLLITVEDQHTGRVLLKDHPVVRL